MSLPVLVLLGYGALNRQLAVMLKDRFIIHAISRTPPSPGHSWVHHHAHDLATAWPRSLRELKPRFVVACLAPGRSSDDYRRTYVRTAAELCQSVATDVLQAVLWASSTSVYAQCNDEWVDEDSQTAPQNESAKQLLEAEQILESSALPCTSVRFSGIYGGERSSLVDRIRRGSFCDRKPSAYTNRIHEFDAVAVLAYLLMHGSAGNRLADRYLASDDEPVRRHEIEAWIAGRLGIGAPSAPAPPARAGSKRCRNTRLRDTGFCFRYPDFRAGYEPILAQLN